MEQYLKKIKPYMGKKKYLTMKVNFMSSKDNGNKRLMNSKSDNKEIMIDNEADEIMNQIFSSLLHRY